MDYGSAFLYADGVAGCRVYSLTLDGDEGTWADVTDEDELMAGSELSPDAKAETYRLPPKARQGGYLFCVPALSGHASVGSELCGRFDL